MKFLPTDLPGVRIIEPDVFSDERGYFLETFQAQKYRTQGIPESFVQDNLSRSVRGTLRGLHAQSRHPQGKLIRVVEGEIFDVAVDIRKGSPTFCRWVGVVLAEKNFRQCYIPPGFAHGFCVSSDFAVVEYKCTDFYHPSDEITLRWNDPAFEIQWPVENPLLSSKDRTALPLKEMMDQLPLFQMKL